MKRHGSEKTEGPPRGKTKRAGKRAAWTVRLGGEAQQRRRAQSLTLLTEEKRRLKNSDEWSAGNLRAETRAVSISLALLVMLEGAFRSTHRM